MRLPAHSVGSFFFKNMKISINQTPFQRKFIWNFGILFLSTLPNFLQCPLAFLEIPAGEDEGGAPGGHLFGHQETNAAVEACHEDRLVLHPLIADQS